jgi:methylphosphotriester-DNA--protein-cysteine methyltransferase
VRLDDLAREVGWTKSHFCRVFKKVEGVTVGEWVKGWKEKGRGVPRWRSTGRRRIR